MLFIYKQYLLHERVESNQQRQSIFILLPVQRKFGDFHGEDYDGLPTALWGLRNARRLLFIYLSLEGKYCAEHDFAANNSYLHRAFKKNIKHDLVNMIFKKWLPEDSLNMGRHDVSRRLSLPPCRWHTFPPSSPTHTTLGEISRKEC